MLDVAVADLMDEGEAQYYSSTLHSGVQVIKPSALTEFLTTSGPDFCGVTGMWALDRRPYHVSDRSKDIRTGGLHTSAS